jgi:hypothetical protein
VDFDTASMWDSTNKYAVIPRTGYYQILTNVTYQAVTNSGYKRTSIKKGASTVLSFNVADPQSVNQVLGVVDVLYLTAGDTVYATAFTRLIATNIYGSTISPQSYMFIKEL